MASIPTIDLSPFFNNEDESGKIEAIRSIGHASKTLGFFRIVNHGMPLELMDRAIEICKAFFCLPEQEKVGSKFVEGYPLPVGYVQPAQSPDKNEYVIMLSPERGVNVYPANPHDFRSTFEECFTKLFMISLIIEDILNECLGLPPNFLKDHNNKDGRNDVMAALRYFPLDLEEEEERVGLSEHQDANYISLLFQDEVGGLEVLMDGQWIRVEPIKGSIIVNIADIIQVMSNNKLMSATHRVVRKEKHRHSVVFFSNVPGSKWVEPLPQFTTEIGELPQYRGFLYKEYHAMRVRNKTHPPSTPEGIIHITHYAINN